MINTKVKNDNFTMLPNDMSSDDQCSKGVSFE